MFGMALRSYQKKLRRLTESRSAANRTLWRAVLEHIRREQRVRKADLLARFAHDGEREVGSTLSDLVNSGLVYQTGRGLDALYRVTSDVDLRHLAGSDDPSAVAPVVWSIIYDKPGTTEAEVARSLELDTAVVSKAVQSLIDEGRMRRDGDGPSARLSAEDLLVPVGAAQGWEVAVHDHFRAVANAIASKVRTRTVQSVASDVVGGATLSFDLSEGHPYRAQVHALLAEVRERVNTLWNEVETYNARKPIAEDDRERVFFYFGQYIEEREDAASEDEHASHT